MITKQMRYDDADADADAGDGDDDDDDDDDDVHKTDFSVQSSLRRGRSHESSAFS